MSEPITREETYLAAIAGDGVDLPNPITREELYLASAAGMAVELPNPITRKEQFLQRVVESGGTGGGGVTIRNQNKTITQNGQYKADSGYTGLGTVTVSVPQEEPVLQDKTATQNGRYTADSGFDGLGTVTVAVPEPALQDKTVTENGEYTADSGYDGLGKVTVNVAASGGGDALAQLVNGTIVEVHNEDVTVISPQCFCSRKQLTKVSLPNAKSVGGNAFQECGYLVEVYLPSVETVNARAFDSCSSLKKIDLPSLKQVTYWCFSGCDLREVHFDALTNLGFGCLMTNKNLEFVDFPKVSTISQEAFNGDTSLAKVVLRSTTLVSLVNISAFNGTPFASGGSGGTVYVPAALISAYQTATNWSTLYAAGTCNFVAIEGSEYE